MKTILCMHDLERDIEVSKRIWNSTTGVFEEETLKLFTNYLAENPDWLVIDFGSHIGQYTLFAAKMGHHVISVEPFHDSLLRIHKASHLEHTQNKIVLINNAISNRRREVRQLNYELENIGGQSLLDLSGGNKFKFAIPDTEKHKYSVETILIDDIVEHIPKNRDERPYEKCMIKIGRHYFFGNFIYL